MRITARRLLAASVVLAACGEESAPAPRGLASIDTIDYRTTKGAIIEASEVARISSMAADITPVDYLRSLVILSDGSIAITQPQDPRIVFFSGSGELLGSFGRRGGAPGEFRGIFGIGLLGDTLWAGDTRQDRVTLIGSDRRLLRTFTIPFVEGESNSNSDVSMKVVLGLERDAFVGILPLQGEQLIRARLDGTILHMLPRSENQDRNVQIGTVTTSGDLFGTGSRFDVSADGTLIAITRPLTADDQQPVVSLTLIRSTADTAYVRVVNFEGVRITRSAIDSAVAKRTRNRPPDYTAAFRRQAYIPTYFPPVESVVIGQDGRVWLKLHAAEQQEYLVFGAEGGLLGTVVFPPRTTVRAARGDIVWALQLNEFDVADIVKFQIAEL